MPTPPTLIYALASACRLGSSRLRAMPASPTPADHDYHCALCTSKAPHSKEEHKVFVENCYAHDEWMADYLGVPDASEARQ